MPTGTGLLQSTEWQAGWQCKPLMRCKRGQMGTAYWESYKIDSDEAGA